MESWVGPVYFVIFSYWGGPVPYLELFGGGPVKKNTLYKLQRFVKANKLILAVLKHIWHNLGII